MHLAARAILIPLACLLFGACTISHEHRIVSVSLSGVTIDSASGTMFVAFSGIIVEPLYFETDTGCRQPDGELFVIESFSGSAVRFEDGIVVGDGGSLESQLVSAGYAVPDPANRSTQYSDLMRESVSARKSGRGIWNPCPPADVWGAVLQQENIEGDWGDANTSNHATMEPPPLTIVEEVRVVSESNSHGVVETAPAITPRVSSESLSEAVTQERVSWPFSCDPTRKTCKAMTSCDEAKFFLANCGTKTMDGDKDGIPCESLCRK